MPYVKQIVCEMFCSCFSHATSFPCPKTMNSRQKNPTSLVIMHPSLHCGRILKIFVLIATLVFSSCSSNRSQYSSNIKDALADEPWMEKFLDNYFGGQVTAYTLFGSKPMTEIPVCCASKEEWVSNYKKFIQEECPEDEQEKALNEFTEYLATYDLPENWEKWVNWAAKNLPRKFLFSKKPTLSDDVFSLYILNVHEAVWILQRNYFQISRELGIEFDPVEVVMQFEDQNSLFWEKVFQSHFVRGLMHGYGERNSYFFDLSMKIRSKKQEMIIQSDVSAMESQTGFPIPSFRSYYQNQKDDPFYQHYSRERKHISKVLARKNLYEKILHQLGYSGANKQKACSER